MALGTLIKSMFQKEQASPASEPELVTRRRRFQRKDAYKPCTVVYPSGFTRRGVVVDLSERGVRIRFSTRAGLPDFVKVRIDGLRGEWDGLVAWQDQVDAGIRFRA